MDKKLWVDCFTDKFLYLHPFISEHLAFVNKWCLEIKFTESKIEIENDFNDVDYFMKLLEFYKIKRCDYIDISDIRLPAIMLCDMFYLPYTRNYNINNMEHCILIKKDNNNGTYDIYDDNPGYDSALDYTVIRQSFKSFILFEHETGSAVKSFEEELLFFSNNVIQRLNNTLPFITQLIDADLPELKKMQLLSNFKTNSMRFNSLCRVYGYLAKTFSDNETIIQAYNSVLQYTQEWSLIVGIGHKGYVSKNTRFWSKINERLKDIAETEFKANEDMAVVRFQ
ncbi:MAG: hypothetical protein FWE91_05010 [Defluviitaleaceae bacterium]|nr:hypothetical protein [Defluviitaleaceae bacterium]